MFVSLISNISSGGGGGQTKLFTRCLKKLGKSTEQMYISSTNRRLPFFPSHVVSNPVSTKKYNSLEMKNPVAIRAPT